jgi:uncharacterized membrane protein YqhA
MFRRLFSTSRYVVSLAVIGTFLGSVILLVMSTLTIARIAWEQIVEFDRDKLSEHHLDRIGVQLIGITDMILIGTVLYLVSVGLYQLFVDPNLPVPRWLRVDDLSDLKRDLIGVTVVLLGVSFLGNVVEWDGERDILPLGVGVALVVVALGFILWLTPTVDHEEDEPAS